MRQLKSAALFSLSEKHCPNQTGLMYFIREQEVIQFILCSCLGRMKNWLRCVQRRAGFLYAAKMVRFNKVRMERAEIEKYYLLVNQRKVQQAGMQCKPVLSPLSDICDTI